MNADEFANIVKEQIKNEEHIIVSHSYNSVHIEKRNNEIISAYKKYAPRYNGDDIYDVKTILKILKKINFISIFLIIYILRRML